MVLIMGVCNGITTAGLVPCLILLVGLLFVPESPRWLHLPKEFSGKVMLIQAPFSAKMRRQKEFEVALSKLRGKDADISLEAAEIEIGAGLMCCQQFGGINGVCFYVSQIFVSAGFPSTLGTMLYACLQIPVTAMGAALIERVGRRALLLVRLVIGCKLCAISFYMKVHELSLEAVPALAVTGVLVPSLSTALSIC
ncbi:hypothetical protein Sjap_007675 [Stephania japonica]|uniref:Major facilitator superfamily (MFS) profile domain-containing protein n=1 Tax=Stephania japonica TaxID=461633 RepID=A0AAP0PDR6_9MAGN